MARLEGAPTTGGKQVTTAPLEQLATVLLPQGYTALSVTVDQGEPLSDVVAVLGFLYPGQALIMSDDGKTVSFAPPVDVKATDTAPAAPKSKKGKATNGNPTDDGTAVQ